MNNRLLLPLLLPLLLAGCGPSEEQVALANKVLSLETRVAELDADNSRLAGELASTLAKVENTSALAAIARSDVVARDAALSQAELDLDALRAQLAVAGDETGAARERARMLAGVVSETREALQARVQSFRADAESGEQRIAEIGAHLADSDATAHRLAAELRDLTALHERDRASAAAMSADLGQRLQEARDRNRDLTSLLEQERQTHADESKTLDEALTAARASAAAMSADLGQRLQAARDRSRDLTSLLEQERETHADERKTLDEALTAARASASEIGAHQADSDATAHRLAAELRDLKALHERDRASAAAMSADLGQRLQAARDRNRDLTSLLEQERETHADESKTLDEALTAARASASELGAHLAASISLNDEMERATETDQEPVEQESSADADTSEETAPRLLSLQRQLDAARDRSEQLLGVIDSCQRELREQSRAAGEEPLAVVPLRARQVFAAPSSADLPVG